MADIKGRKQIWTCDNVWPHSVAHVRLDLVNCWSAASWEGGTGGWEILLVISMLNISKKIYYRQEHFRWLLLCWWALLQGGPLCLKVLLPLWSSVACVIQLEVMLYWFLWSGDINWNEMAKLVSCQPSNNHQLGLLDKDLNKAILVYDMPKKSIPSFLMTQSPELHPAPPSKKKKDQGL